MTIKRHSKQVRISTRGYEILEKIARASGKPNSEIIDDTIDLMQDYLTMRQQGYLLRYQKQDDPSQQVEIRILGYNDVKLK